MRLPRLKQIPEKAFYSASETGFFNRASFFAGTKKKTERELGLFVRREVLFGFRNIFADFNFLRVIALFLFEAMSAPNLANQLVH